MRKIVLGTAALAMFSSAAHAAPVDLSTWTAEGGGNWDVAGDNNSVNQTVNGPPTVFYSDFNAFGQELAGTIRVDTSFDNDYIGFVLGFQPGDIAAGTTDFLLIDWKQGTQNAGCGTGFVGLAVSHVSAGLPTLGGAPGPWCHNGAGVTELARGNTLGSTGWADFTEYSFELEYTSTNVKVFVDGTLELDLNGSFSDGRFGFYNYSQQNVTYAGITTEQLPGGVPEPATWAMMLMGFFGLGATMRSRKTKVSLSYA